MTAVTEPVAVPMSQVKPRAVSGEIARAQGATPLLDIQGLKTIIETMRGPLHAVDGVDIQVFPGERIGLVGESGCGKSMTARSILRLLPAGTAVRKEGRVMMQGRDMLTLRGGEINTMRGKEIAMVFQDPLSYLNPRMRVGEQIAEAVRLHQGVGFVEPAVREALAEVGLPDNREFQRRYPHELSGGMRQRVLIAIALACNPKLLIADEPTTALDVTLQAQILELLKRLCDERGLALLLITHDMGVVAGMCDRVYVMYAGQVVESGTVDDLFDSAKHPYTRALLGSALTIERKETSFRTIEGSVPDLVSPAAGCRFRSRCEYAFSACVSDPPVRDAGNNTVRCWL
jgi:oligopeptide/dipeptide ABC transporter ATP-binding protein